MGVELRGPDWFTIVPTLLVVALVIVVCYANC